MNELEYPFDSQYILTKYRKLKRELLADAGSYPVLKIAILCGATVGIFQDVLELFLLNNGFRPEFYCGDYNRYYEEGTFGTTALDDFKPDIVYYHISVRNILQLLEKGIEQKTYVAPSAETLSNYIEQALRGVQNRYSCKVIVNNFELLPYRVMGNADCYHPLGESKLIQDVNHLLATIAQQNENIYLNDLNYQSAYYGLERWFDNSLWYLYKYPFAMDAIPSVAYNVSNIVKSFQGKNKKMLVLDLDNTLWGGIIGDDGVENLSLGSETPKGMLYSDFQKYIKKLMRKGVAIAVCSKNEEEIAISGFTHPASILSYEDFVMFKANWLEKPFNIEAIASETNILTDSIVFADDNPAERKLVSDVLPSIGVLPLDIPENYLRVLDSSGYFEITSITQDDLKRNEYYKKNELRKEASSQYSDYSEYLISLNMSASFRKINPSNISRVVQLINKTNQFNMTTRRFTESELQEYLKVNQHYGICASLQDKFGDNGIVTLALFRIESTCLYLDNWIMSCRVFQRNLEYALFDKLIDFCKENKLTTIVGLFKPTEKNKVVSNFYQSLDFLFDSKVEDVEKWIFKISDYKEKATGIKSEGGFYDE